MSSVSSNVLAPKEKAEVQSGGASYRTCLFTNDARAFQRLCLLVYLFALALAIALVVFFSVVSTRIGSEDVGPQRWSDPVADEASVEMKSLSVNLRRKNYRYLCSTTRMLIIRCS